MLCLKTNTVKKRRAKMLPGFQSVGTADDADLNEIEGMDSSDVPNFPPQWETFAASLSDDLS